MIHIKACRDGSCLGFDMWQPIVSAPYDRDLELAVLDAEGAHALVFPCRRIAGGWITTTDRRWLDVRPTHWREWGATACK